MRDINEQVDAVIQSKRQATQKPKHNSILRRALTRRTYFGIPLVAVLIAGTLVSGALIGFIWSTYTITTTGDLTISGQTEEQVELYYDGIQLTGTLLTTPLDYDTLSAGDEFTAIHQIVNNDGHTYDFNLDLTDMPLEYVDEGDLWYGVTIQCYEHDTTTVLTDFTVNPNSEFFFDIFYSVDPLFAEPQTPFPFSLTITILRDTNVEPIAIDDNLGTCQTGHTYIVDVLANDIDPDGPDALTVISLGSYNPHLTCTIENNMVKIVVSSAYGWGGNLVVPYTISDGIDTATANIHLYIDF